MISIKSQEEIKVMKKAGAIGALAMKAALGAVREGATTLGINDAAEKVILSAGAVPGFKTVRGYDFATCINVNEGVVHGVPNNYRIQKGDLISVDLGAFYKGFHSDLAYTIEVGTNKETKFLNVGKKALKESIKACFAGNRLGDISNAIQMSVEGAGYSVSRDLVGHGIGKNLHEVPQVPCYGKKGTGVFLKEGMVFAIEVIYQKGDPDLVMGDDDWTLETADGSLAGLFEHVVAVTGEGPLVLTVEHAPLLE
jgi:methionyl aminopeptidase